MTQISRRSALSLLGATPLLIDGPTTAPAREPSGFKLSLSAYGMRKYLDLKSKQPDKMDYFQFADWAAELGLGAIEVTSYYVPEVSPAWLAKFKRHCHRRGLDVSGVAIATDFCLADTSKREAELSKATAWLAAAEYLGAKTLRVFAGTTPKGDTEEAARARCVASLKRLGDEAVKHGVIAAVENHGGITATAEQLIAIVEGVGHEWVGVNLDSGNFREPDPYQHFARVADRAVVVQVKTDVTSPGGKKSATDFAKVFAILREAKYRGFVSLEYEGAEEPRTAIPRYLKVMREWV